MVDAQSDNTAITNVPLTIACGPYDRMVYDDLDEIDRTFGRDPWKYGRTPNRANLGAL